MLHRLEATAKLPGRAWVEVDFDDLESNMKVLRSLLPAGCAPMAVVKANAYGHGDAAICHELARQGVTAFAVACAHEGVLLRKAGIRQDILVMGYTHPQDIHNIAEYDLIQTIVDLPYAKALNALGTPLRTHVKIDTGMRRLGEDCHDVDAVAAMYGFANLQVEGTFSHLCVADSAQPDDTSFTKIQMERFFALVHALRQRGVNPGKLHIQNSFGTANYAGMPCDYVRLGILMYGVLIDKNDTVDIYPQLRPVAAVRARVAQVKQVAAGESVSYGRSYTATEGRTIAVITCGYADGIPRSLSGGRGHVLLGGRRAPIVGRICMDMLMADVTGIPGVQPGDVATFVGRDGDAEIRVEEISAIDGSITHETLTQLGARLHRIYLRAGQIVQR